MKYDFMCSADPGHHPVIEVQHSMHEEHPEIKCEICGEVMIRKYSDILMAGRTPDPGGMIVDYLDHNWHRKKAGLPRWSPHKIRRPPE